MGDVSRTSPGHCSRMLATMTWCSVYLNYFLPEISENEAWSIVESAVSRPIRGSAYANPTPDSSLIVPGVVGGTAEMALFLWPSMTIFGTRRLPLPTQQNGYRSLLQVTGVRAASGIARRWRANPCGRSRMALKATQRFADQLAAVRAGRGLWPSRWPGNASNVSALLAELVVNRTRFVAPAALDDLVPDLQPDIFHSFSSNQLPLGSQRSWDVLRRVADPSIRRTLFWVVARTIDPRVRHANIGLRLLPDAGRYSESEWIDVLIRCTDIDC